MKKVRGVSLVLKKDLVGNPFVPKCILAYAGKEIGVIAVGTRQTDPSKSPLAEVRGKGGRTATISMNFFEDCPAKKKLMAIARPKEKTLFA